MKKNGGFFWGIAVYLCYEYGVCVYRFPGENYQKPPVNICVGPFVYEV